MRSSRSVLARSLAVTAVLGLSLFSAAPAMASGHSLVRDGFEGSVPTGPVIGGVAPGGAPWVLDDDSKVRLREDGRITVKVDDLVIPATATTPVRNPVPFMVASLVCGDAVVDSTDPFAVATEGRKLGDGRITDRIMVPKHCKDPVVLVRSFNMTTMTAGNYFAFTEDKHHHHHD